LNRIKIVFAERDPIFEVFNVLFNREADQKTADWINNWFSPEILDPVHKLNIIRKELDISKQFESVVCTNKAELMSEIGNASALIVERQNIDDEIINRANQLKAVFKYGREVSNIKTSVDIPVYSFRRTACVSVAEHVILFILGLSKQVFELDKNTRKNFQNEGRRNSSYSYNWPCIQNTEPVYKKKLGIIGMGEIGFELAEMVKGLNMQVVYYKRNRLPDQQEKKLNLTYCSFEELLSCSDFVSIHVPHTKETERMIDEREIRQMKPTSFLINTSRGAVVDEDALSFALQQNIIAGAGLDVFKEELSGKIILLKRRAKLC
jgi:glyoxylate reductase